MIQHKQTVANTTVNDEATKSNRRETKSIGTRHHHGCAGSFFPAVAGFSLLRLFGSPWFYAFYFRFVVIKACLFSVMKGYSVSFSST